MQKVVASINYYVFLCWEKFKHSLQQKDNFQTKIFQIDTILIAIFSQL